MLPKLGRSLLNFNNSLEAEGAKKDQQQKPRHTVGSAEGPTSKAGQTQSALLTMDSRTGFVFSWMQSQNLTLKG